MSFFISTSSDKERFTMFFFNLSKKQKVLSSKEYSSKLLELKKRNELDEIQCNNELSTMNNAYEEYINGGDINTCIKTYESILLNGTKWNSFNHCLTLVHLYIKSNRNNDAWRLLNWMQLHFSYLQDHMDSNMSKIRAYQFKILKKEKKYLEAFVLFVSSYTYCVYGSDKNVYFNKNKFIRELKTTAKQIGINEDELLEFSELYEAELKKEHLNDVDAQNFCKNYLHQRELLCSK